MKTLAIESIGLMAPGLIGWSASRAVLAGEQPCGTEPIPATLATLLPANERRRTTATVKLALQVAQEAMASDPQPIHTVLASSGGDSEVLDKICVALTEPGRPVSPTQFHHSVHNTPAGYWAIATGCTLPSISVSARDSSFAAGLREATALAWTEQVPVLLIAYDVPSPFPLSEHRPILAPFAVALRLNPAHTGPHLATVRFQRATNADPTALDHPVLEALRNGNPAARSLPLLCALARRQAQHLILPVGDHEWLGLAVAP